MDDATLHTLYVKENLQQPLMCQLCQMLSSVGC